MGMVKLNRGPLSTVARITLFVVTLSLVIATLFMTHTVEQPALAGAAAWRSRLVGDIFFAALIIGCFTLFAHFTGVPRLYLYGWLIGLGNLASAALMLYAGSTFNWPLALAGLIIVLIGANLFRRFMRRYPIPNQDN